MQPNDRIGLWLTTCKIAEIMSRQHEYSHVKCCLRRRRLRRCDRVASLGRQLGVRVVSVSVIDPPAHRHCRLSRVPHSLLVFPTGSYFDARREDEEVTEREREREPEREREREEGERERD